MLSKQRKRLRIFLLRINIKTLFHIEPDKCRSNCGTTQSVESEQQLKQAEAEYAYTKVLTYSCQQSKMAWMSNIKP